MNHPALIQGGMGAGVSHWKLAKEVSLSGGLGVVSATALDTIIARRLQDGDKDIERALHKFPIPEIAEKIWKKYFKKKKDNRYIPVPFFSTNPPKDLIELTVVANFIEVYLAKEGHNKPIGINLLEKIQMPTLYSLFGAMLAEVDYVIMGAGIPREIPGILDKFSQGETAYLTLNVTGLSKDEKIQLSFNPKEFLNRNNISLKHPFFFAIVSSNVLATTLAKKSTGKVDGFIIENFTAGGHNAPPRVKGKFDSEGAPLYGEKDKIDYEKIKKLEIPFYLAGSYVTPKKIYSEIKNSGASGIQVGTIFALTEESGFNEDIKLKLVDKIRNNEVKVFTDPKASPTGFPFKVASLEGTLSEKEVYEKRRRVCNLRYLVELYKKESGEIGYRCPAEPVEDYVKKGGNIEDTVGRKCLCNALLANIGLGNIYQDGYKEPYLVTMGDSIKLISHLLPENGLPKTKDVVAKLFKYIKEGK